MRIKKQLLFILCILLTPLIAFGQQYELMRVAKLEIVPENLSPDHAFNPNSVRAGMHTKIGNYFSQIEFDNDLKVLAGEYDRIEPCIDVVNGALHIAIHIWFKPTIHSIQFCGNEQISTSKLSSTFELECNTQFEREAFIQGINNIRQLYVKKGYFESEVEYDLCPLEGNQVDIQIRIQEGRAGKIKEVCFSGITKSEESDLLQSINTRRYNFFLSWYTGGGIYHPEMIERDRLQILNYFQNCGYADATVQMSIQEVPNCNRIRLMIDIEKGECYTVGTLSLCGNTLFSTQEIWDQFTFGQGSLYSPEQIGNTIQAITDLYGTGGYIDTNVDFQISLRPNSPVYDICVSITEGERFYVGLIKVFGNRYTQTRIILHESLLFPGEIFNNGKLEGTELRLINSGFFSAVNVYAVRSQIEDPNNLRNYRDVYIEVEESDTGNLGLFAGFSSIDRIFGGIEITERNFNIAGIPHILENGPTVLRGAAEFAHAKINVGDKQTNYSIQWTKPYFLDTPWIVGIDLEKNNNRALSHAYEIRTYGGNVHATYILNPFLKFDTHYRARHTSVATRDEKNLALEREGSHGGFISATGLSFIYDSTDSPRRAHCGFRSRLMYELAGLGGNFQFMKLAYLNAYYVPVSERGTLKFRAELQLIKTYGTTNPHTLPLSERLFLGGETTVRGYRPFIIGPKFANNEPSGGVTSYLLSEEYQHNLLRTPCLDGFVFVDAGYVSNREFRFGRPAASVGFGIRIEVMRNMPLMMGLGWPIHPMERLNGVEFDNAQRFFFAMGGSF